MFTPFSSWVTPPFFVVHSMLDINLFFADKGGNPELIRESRRRRYAPVEIVDDVISLYDVWNKRIPILDT